MDMWIFSDWVGKIKFQCQTEDGNEVKQVDSDFSI